MRDEPPDAASGPLSPDDEFIDVVDENNAPLAVLSLREAHRQTLYHRSVLVLVYNSRGKVFLQKRSLGKDRYPGRWDISATGHVRSEESLHDAAVRELYEELGISVSSLRRVGEVEAGPETGYEFVTLFSAGVVSTVLTPNPDEVLDGYFFDDSELSCLVEQFRELLTPGLVHFWEKGLIFGKAAEA
ncbi:NUDIX hydrolase [Desulfohalovibrio reitneri]|uniref:NUDIX hydrolase n=1 Tax=Desulfohalovibrio reitneri TaxID=1307759 RepID=UPI0004A706D0|nr:NUDIX domain-containing protein [Desulfohalovibrio reitneri]